ncbi:hypothetical protein [Pontibacter roseus]|uniref:hypothetical protein n=1 Tax=Pontibacter roseus TaxID=336989 RepID=UPI000525EF0F|nr:hypothetical protein [Pontibacter roseus]
MNSLKINLPIPPQPMELEKKANFYKVMAAILFLIGVVIIFSKFTVFSSLMFLLFAFASYRVLKAANGEDFLKVLDNSYLYIDEERFTLHQSQYAFQRGELTLENTVFWTWAKELRISPEAFEVLMANGERRRIGLDFLTGTKLSEVLDRLYEVKARYNL